MSAWIAVALLLASPLVLTGTTLHPAPFPQAPLSKTDVTKNPATDPFPSMEPTLALPPLFSDHMVLQRDTPNPIRGRAGAGAMVEVTLERMEQTGNAPVAAVPVWRERTAAGGDGEWELALPERPAGGPWRITAASGGQRIAVEDVWFGEVWVAGGQSNMEWKLEWGVRNLPLELEAADLPMIRFFDVPNEVDSESRDWVSGGEWKVADPETAKSFSAVAWFFARHAVEELGVPVGILDSNWGGTPAEAWTPVETLLGMDAVSEAARAVVDARAEWPARFERNRRLETEKFERIGSRELAEQVFRDRILTGDVPMRPVELPTGEPLHDFAWIEREVEISCDDSACDGPGRLMIGGVSQEAFVFWNGEYLGRKDWVDTGVDMMIPAGRMRPGANRLTLRVANSWDNQVRVGEPGGMRLQWGPAEVDLEGPWNWTPEAEPPMPDVVRYEWSPTFLYNAMIHPLRKTPVRGVIWYQGESNVERASEYRDLFTAMIGAWRGAWGQPEMPFVFVQLANYLARVDHPTESAWAELREAQRQVSMAVPGTGMAVAIDIGEAEDIHPRNKQDVGHRLWLQARRVAYGLDGVPGGPVPVRAWAAPAGSRPVAGTLDGAVGGASEVDGMSAAPVGSQPVAGTVDGAVDGAVLVFFQTDGSTLRAAGSAEPEGFELAGADGIFRRATARIEGVDRVRLMAPGVDRPVWVRYGWADNPVATLVNEMGLPGTPFQIRVEDL